MTARQQRRLEERKARKNTQKAQAAAPETAIHSNRAEANKQNAQHSTGPRTPEGKLNSSKNSFKHGLYSKQLMLPGEDLAELDALREDLRREHQPGTTTEEILVNELAEHYWRLRRMRKYEARAMSAENFETGLGILPIIQRTMASAERGFHKALKALTDLQRQRGFVPQIQQIETGFVSQAAINSPLPTSDDGFVSQNDLPESPIHIPEPEQHHFEAA